VLILRQLPGYGDFLVCGISTQLWQAIPDFDELVSKSDDDFSKSGLKESSVIRLGFLAILPNERVLGSIGKISHVRHNRLLRTLSAYLIRAP
jgi:mRNA interferase MazF